MKQEKIGRNHPCWCGTQEKYKHCHLNSEVYFFKADDSSIQVKHTGYLYLLDNKQKIRALYRSDVTIPQLYSGLQKLLK